MNIEDGFNVDDNDDDSNASSLDRDKEFNEDIELMLNFLQVVILINKVIKKHPIIKINKHNTIHQKLLWKLYLQKHQDKQHFIKRHLRMSIDSFNKLLSYIKKDLVISEYHSNKPNAVTPELCLFCTLRYLAGCSYLDIHAMTGVSITSFYRVFYITCKLIIKCPEMKMKFPKTLIEFQQIALGFKNVSFQGAIENCVGCIDGYLLKIYTPTKLEAGNVKSFFSGHYQCHGINIQAVCDAKSRFLFFALAAPGSVNDRDAIKKTTLIDHYKHIPPKLVIIGDCAYEPSEIIVPMFYGVNKNKPDCDAFNFYASQCRIRIEMAFGLMQMKWGILWRPVRVKLKNIKYVMRTIALLHNFVINERILENDDEEEEMVEVGNNRAYLPSVVENANGDPIELATDGVIVGTRKEKNVLPGVSFIRDYMTNRIQSMGLKRPKKNIIKRNIEEVYY